ncbi:hypothetical protein [Succinivibrio faecicola]|uniref:Uncharacterized protein n=1 Tax=Succinivibrio faecicola TaxID=2820300 RepID=A0ABS7DIA2_9GAMM|nr:hypothetical protein [Succinivibrio faecicola]MBW7571020.1 hypothetical protein [Succinivibrio faecicola]
MKIEISLSQWSVIQNALVDDIEDFKKTAELETSNEASRTFLYEAATRRERVLKALQEQIKEQF